MTQDEPAIFCPVKTCCRTISGRQVVCSECWRRLPGPTRERIFWLSTAPRIFQQAVTEAVAWLNAKAAAPP